MKLKIPAILAATFLAAILIAPTPSLAAQTVTRITAPDTIYRDYIPGTFSTQIPERFLPQPTEEWIEVSADYDERVGRVVPGTAAKEARAREQRERKKAQEAAVSQPLTPNESGSRLQPNEKKVPDGSTDKKESLPGIPAPRPQTVAPQQKVDAQTNNDAIPKTKKILKLTSPPNPYRMPQWSDFRAIRNASGKYTVQAPLAFGSENPLEGLPVDGPMLIRSASNVLMFAVTVDDPADTKYYKPQNNFPVLKGSVILFREHRPAVNNRVVTVNFRQGFVGGVDCIEVLSEYKTDGRTFRTLWIFPEQRKYELLAQALYAIETLQFAG